MGRRHHSPAAIAIRAARLAEDALIRHCKECPRCTRARNDVLPMIYCDAGWQLAKAATRLANMADREREREHVGDGSVQLAMF